MIIFKLEAESTGSTQLNFILEPRDLACMQSAMPVVSEISELIPHLNTKVEILIGYSPDINWVAEQVKLKLSDNFFEALVDSLSRPEVYRENLDLNTVEVISFREEQDGSLRKEDDSLREEDDE